MNCNTTEAISEESSHRPNFQALWATADSMVDETEHKEHIQLQKFQDPSKDVNRQAYIFLLSTYGDLLIHQKVQEIAERLLTEDCHIFWFTSTRKVPVQYSNRPEGFVSLYKGVKVLERKVRQNFVDLEKRSAFQLCSCRILYEGDQDPVEEITFEAFSIENERISKIRACFGQMTPAHEGKDPFRVTIKEKMLAKVKEINYAFAGQPDFEKVASLLHDNVEYRISPWASEKCSLLRKQDFASGFRNIQKDYSITYIVPYGTTVDRDFVIGHYVYHLEGKKSLLGEKFVWLCTCMYVFDKDLSVIKVNQEGELYPENQAPPNPFEVYSREEITRKVQEITAEYKPNFDIFYNSDVHYNCDICQFGRQSFPDTGSFQGINDYGKCILKNFRQEVQIEWVKIVDIYVDHHDPSYDVAITLSCSQGTFNQKGYGNSGKRMNFISLAKWGFENEKLSKFLLFLTEIPEAIPSPFDDNEFEGVNIRPKKNIK